MSSTSDPAATVGPTSASAVPPAGSPPADSNRWLALVVIGVAQLMVVLDASIVNIALPSAQRDLGITDADRQWVITAYTLAFGGLLLLGGRIADYVGRKRVFVIGLVGFAAASALGGASVNAFMLYGSRALQGAFAALLAPAALSLISVTFTEPSERARAFGVYGAISGGGAAIGLILGGVLTEYANWRWCLFVNVPIAIAAAVAAVALVHESRNEGHTKYDLPGAVLVTAGLLALVYGFTEAARPGVGWASGTTLSLFALAAVLLVAFVMVEARSEQPLLPLRVLLDRNRGGVYLGSLMIGAGLFAMFLFLTYYFQINLHYSPLRSGFAFLPFSAGIVVGASVASNVLPRSGPKPLLLLGLGMATVGLLYLTRLGLHTSWVSHVLPAEVLMSLGLGMVFVPLSGLALSGIGPQDAGVASAVLNTSQQVGGSLGTALLNTLYASAVTSYLGSHVKAPQDVQKFTLEAYVHGYHIAFLVGAALLAAAMIAILFLVNASRDAVSPEQAVAPVG